MVSSFYPHDFQCMYKKVGVPSPQYFQKCCYTLQLDVYNVGNVITTAIPKKQKQRQRRLDKNNDVGEREYEPTIYTIITTIYT